MGDVVVDLSVSLDGFIAGIDAGPGRPLGGGGERLFTSGGGRGSPWVSTSTSSPRWG
jgi:hypothetical protein